MSTAVIDRNEQMKKAREAHKKAKCPEEALAAMSSMVRLTIAPLAVSAPQGVDGQRLVEQAASYVASEEKLHTCTPRSLVQCVRKAFLRGMEVGEDCYLIPRKRKVQNASGQWVEVVECNLQPSPRGDMKIIERSGEIITKRLGFVYEGETVDINEHPDGTRRIDHKESMFCEARNADDDSKIVAVYWKFKLKNGATVEEYMTRGQVEAHKAQYSDAYGYAEKGRKDSAWHTSWKEMAAKTLLRWMVARRLVPVSVDDRRLMLNEDEPAGDVLDAEFTITDDIEATEATPAKQEAAQ